MQLPLEIRFHNLDRTEALEAAVRDRALALERFASHIVSCRVTIEAPHQHQRRGQLYRVTVDVRLPGGELVASRSPTADHSHEDVLVAVRDAFKATRRQLQDYVRVQRADVKTRIGPPRGTIASLNLAEDHGRIETPDGRSIYFHRNSIVNADFDGLHEGMEVTFHEEPGDAGPQASSVHVVGK